MRNKTAIQKTSVSQSVTPLWSCLVQRKNSMGAPRPMMVEERRKWICYVMLLENVCNRETWQSSPSSLFGAANCHSNTNPNSDPNDNDNEYC